ncbi:hypothetical protein BJX99DRAFT_105700 [Aspergillus californicus]
MVKSNIEERENTAHCSLVATQCLVRPPSEELVTRDRDHASPATAFPRLSTYTHAAPAATYSSIIFRFLSIHGYKTLTWEQPGRIMQFACVQAADV